MDGWVGFWYIMVIYERVYSTGYFSFVVQTIAVLFCFYEVF